MDEIWKDITGFENMYQVSNLGRVKSLPKLKRVTVFNKAHIKIMTKERIIGGSLDKSGYIQIKKYRIHRLGRGFLAAYCRLQYSKPQKRHKER